MPPASAQPTNPPPQLPPKRKSWNITKETAPEFQRRAQAAKLLKRHLQARTRVELREEFLHHLTLDQRRRLEPYIIDRLVRVRVALERIDEMLISEKDAGKIDRLASAAQKLNDQEFALAGRPKPGQLSYAPAQPDSVLEMRSVGSLELVTGSLQGSENPVPDSTPAPAPTGKVDPFCGTSLGQETTGDSVPSRSLLEAESRDPETGRYTKPEQQAT
jgi:hypothetical protein